MGQKKRHHKSRSRSRSPNRRHEERSYRRHREPSSEDSRDGSRRSPDYTSRSRRKSPSPNHLRSRRSRSRDKDYRSRDRKRSRSRDKRRNRSRDRRSRSRERRRNRSRERRRSRSRSRSRSHERSSRHHRSNSRERKRSCSKEKQTSETTSQSQQTSQKSDHNRDLSLKIPGYENMTPAEQIKAKVKLMVEKSKVSQSPSETFVPSPSQLASIDNDGFEQTSFSSTQVPGKTQGSSFNGHSGSVRGGSRYDSRSVDASEYAPRVVELSSAVTEQDSPQSSTSNQETVPDEERKSKWLKRLQLLREKHGH